MIIIGKNGSLIYQLKQNLQSKAAFGESRHLNKIEDKTHKTSTTKDKIYSFNTMKTYLNQGSAFVKFVKQQHPECRMLDDCRKYADDYLQNSIDRGLSPYTIKTQLSALCKIFGDTASDYLPTPARSQALITRSRFDVARDCNFSAFNNRELIAVAESTGLRRAELENLKGSSLFLKNDKYYLEVKEGTKGGKPRITEIYHPNSKTFGVAIKAIKNAGENKVFQKVHSAYDVHNARSIYARNLYSKYERDVSDLDRSERYYSKTMSKRYDREAMNIVSKNLGHSRPSIVVFYFRK